VCLPAPSLQNRLKAVLNNNTSRGLTIKGERVKITHLNQFIMSRITKQSASIEVATTSKGSPENTLEAYYSAIGRVCPPPSEGPFPMAGVDWEDVEALPPLHIPSVEEIGLQESLPAIHISDLTVGDVILVGSVDQCLFDPDETTGRYGNMPRGYGFRVVEIGDSERDWDNTPKVTVEMVRHPALRSEFLKYSPQGRASFTAPMIFKGRPLILRLEGADGGNANTSAVRQLSLVKDFETFEQTFRTRTAALGTTSGKNVIV